MWAIQYDWERAETQRYFKEYLAAIIFAISASVILTFALLIKGTPK